MKDLYKEAQRIAKHVFKNTKLTYQREPGDKDYYAVVIDTCHRVLEAKHLQGKNWHGLHNVRGLNQPSTRNKKRPSK